MKIVDLTLEIYDGLQTFKNHPKISIKEESTFENSKHRYEPPCNGFESRMISMSDHSGTHIDAPLHFIAEGESTSEMQLERTIGKAYLLDVSNYKKPDERVTAEMLERAEKVQGLQIEKGNIVLVQTRKGKWGDESFFNEEAFDISAGKWFTAKQINAVGIDLPNIDSNDNMKRDVHLEVLGANIYIIENMVNLENLPRDRSFQFFAAPLKLKNATGSPVRAFAMID